MKKDVFEGHLEMGDAELTRLSEALADTDPVTEPDKYLSLLMMYEKAQKLVNDSRANYESLEKLDQAKQQMATSRLNKQDDLKMEKIKTAGGIGAAVVGTLGSLFGLRTVIRAESDPDNPVVMRPSFTKWIPTFKR